MDTKNKESGFASRLLHGAKDLIWQDDPIVNRNAYQRDGNVIGAAGGKLDQRRDVLTDSELNTNPMADDLFKVVMNRPTAYSSLAEAINALSGISMDEATRYRSAFAVLKKTQQRTVEQITQAVDVHLGLLESEIVRFSSQSRSAEEDEIASRQKAVDLLESEANLANDQIVNLRIETDNRIRQLQEEIVHKKARSSELAREAEQKRQAILQTTKNFEEAIDAVRTKLSNEKMKIQNFLGSTSN
ncbi:MAG TPA: hypothetical protein VIF82_01890 [Burkholderiaceae bacterium]